jgi:Zn-dependent protease
MHDIDIVKVVASVIALAIAIIGHEIMHGYVAYHYGDTTAKDAGRLSLNPIVHVDPIGTIALPLILFVTGAPFLFGWAKPVPIDAYRVLRNGSYFGMFNVSMAGIFYNIFMAVAAAALLGLNDSMWINAILLQLVVYNVILAMFNLLPIPPLDGSKALSYLGVMMGTGKLAEFFYKIERWGMVILVLFLLSPLSGIFFSWAREIILWLVF